MQVTPNVAEIKKRRENLGLSQHLASLQAGLTGCTLHRIEKKKTKKISYLGAREIARVLGCKVEDICSLPERSA